MLPSEKYFGKFEAIFLFYGAMPTGGDALLNRRTVNAKPRQVPTVHRPSRGNTLPRRDRFNDKILAKQKIIMSLNTFVYSVDYINKLVTHVASPHGCRL
jgi:hypothetical protein